MSGVQYPVCTETRVAEILPAEVPETEVGSRAPSDFVAETVGGRRRTSAKGQRERRNNLDQWAVLNKWVTPDEPCNCGVFDCWSLKHNFNRKLRGMVVIRMPPITYDIMVTHEADCASSPQGYCDCEPMIILEPELPPIKGHLAKAKTTKVA